MNQGAVVAVILAGGRGSRIGGGKALVSLLGEPMVAHVAAVLRPAVADLAVAGDRGAADLIGAIPLLDGPGDAAGPLRGVLAGLEWARARGAAWLVVAPCDTPLLPVDLVRRLMDGVAAEGAGLGCAETPSGVQPLVSVWNADLAPMLGRELANGHPPVREVIERCGAAAIRFDDETAFFNVNSPLDLAEAEELMSARTSARLPRQLR